jgi:hypothetical protein
MKKGPAVKTWVVNPFTHVDPRSAPGLLIRSGIEQAMSDDRPDVKIKRNTTIDFLDHVVETEPAPVHLLHR